MYSGHDDAQMYTRVAYSDSAMISLPYCPYLPYPVRSSATCPMGWSCCRISPPWRQYRGSTPSRSFWRCSSTNLRLCPDRCGDEHIFWSLKPQFGAGAFPNFLHVNFQLSNCPTAQQGAIANDLYNLMHSEPATAALRQHPLIAFDAWHRLGDHYVNRAPQVGVNKVWEGLAGRKCLALCCENVCVRKNFHRPSLVMPYNSCLSLIIHHSLSHIIPLFPLFPHAGTCLPVLRSSAGRLLRPRGRVL